MYHPLPPNLGPGVYLGAVERATSFITDDVWYGIYAGTNPGRAVISYVVKIGDSVLLAALIARLIFCIFKFSRDDIIAFHIKH